MKEIIMLKENLIAEILERLIEIKGRNDRAGERLARLKLKAKPPALWTEELINECIKDVTTPLVQVNADLIAMQFQLTAEVAEWVAAIDHAVLQVSLAYSEEEADPLLGVTDDDESTADEGGAP